MDDENVQTEQQSTLQRSDELPNDAFEQQSNPLKSSDQISDNAENQTTTNHVTQTTKESKSNWMRRSQSANELTPKKEQTENANSDAGSSQSSNQPSSSSFTSTSTSQPSTTISDFALSRMSIEERDKLRRKGEHEYRKQQQQLKVDQEKKKAEEEKLKRKESFILKRSKSNNFDPASLPNAQNNSSTDTTKPDGEHLYDQEERYQREQMERLTKGLPVNQSSHHTLKGFDAELHEKMNGKMETKTEDQIREWVEALTNEEVYDTFDALRSGIILCKLINAIKPGTIPKFNERPNPIMERDNIKLYLEACEKLGMSKNSLFHVSDLHDQRNIPLVLQNIYGLCRTAAGLPDFSGPLIEGAKPFTNLNNSNGSSSGNNVRLSRSRTIGGIEDAKQVQQFQQQKLPATQPKPFVDPNYQSSAPEAKFLRKQSQPNTETPIQSSPTKQTQTQTQTTQPQQQHQHQHKQQHNHQPHHGTNKYVPTGQNLSKSDEANLYKMKVRSLETELAEEKQKFEEEIQFYKNLNQKLKSELEEQHNHQMNEISEIQRKSMQADEKNRQLKRLSMDQNLSKSVCMRCEERERSHSILLESLVSQKNLEAALISALWNACRQVEIKPQQMEKLLQIFSQHKIRNIREMAEFVRSATFKSEIRGTLDENQKSVLEKLVLGGSDGLDSLQNSKVQSTSKMSWFWFGSILILSVAATIGVQQVLLRKL